MPPDRYTLFEGAACKDWGRWDSVPLLKREREGATGGHAGRWWLPPVRRGTSSNLCTLADEKALAPPPELTTHPSLREERQDTGLVSGKQDEQPSVETSAYPRAMG